jgi:AMMECR1 domain-containing protein
LSEPQPLAFSSPEELLEKTAGKPGIILQFGSRSATFLPQVWDELPQPEQFLAHLCMKACLAPLAWRERALRIWTYQADVFAE